MSIVLTLSSDGTDCDSSEEFDRYVSFVSERISAWCRFQLSVEAGRYGVGGPDRILGASKEQEETIKEFVQSIWFEWCETA